MKYYVVSDVHGFYSQLEKALRIQGFFDDKEPHKLIVCGDIFDRGPEAIKLQQFILQLIEKDEVILIKGNHEDLAQDLLDFAQVYFYNPRKLENSHHYHNGTVNTFLQLTSMFLEEAVADVDLFVEKAKRTPYMANIMPKMLDYFETGHYVFVHGWIPCCAYNYGGHYIYENYRSDWRDSTSKEWEKARWYNGMECACLHKILEPNKTIICGHYHCSYGHCKFGDAVEEFGKRADFAPFYAEGIIAIDACTAYSGQVNCIVIRD